MIKLDGRISVKRLYGKINLVPSSGNSGGPLQAKTAYPSHSEQIIAPDEDYYGLVSVTVKPVPKLPACVVEIKTPSGVEYYYNHEQLLEIPSDVVENYPYIIVFRSPSNRQLYASTQKPYTHEVDGVLRLTIPEGGWVRYNYNASADAWVLYAVSTASSYFNFQGQSAWAVWWSNYDIPNGSPDAEEIYFPASLPQEEQPADATHFYYNGVRLPKIPEDVLAEYPYAWIRKHTTSGAYQLVFATYPWYYNSGAVYCSGGEKVTEPWYNITIATADTATEWTFNKNTTGNFPVDDTRPVLWSNHDIPNGSADATDIYFYGTLAVPDPME